MDGDFHDLKEAPVPTPGHSDSPGNPTAEGIAEGSEKLTGRKATDGKLRRVECILANTDRIRAAG